MSALEYVVVLVWTVYTIISLWDVRRRINELEHKLDEYRMGLNLGLAARYKAEEDAREHR